MTSDRDNHKLIGALSRALRVMYWDREIFGLHYMVYYEKMTTEIHNLRAIRRSNKSLRKRGERKVRGKKWALPTRGMPSYQKRERSLITTNFNDTFTKGGRRKISLEIGKRVSVERREDRNYGTSNRTYTYKVTVGWLWYRTVYQPFYKDNCLDRRWIVLKAEELSVNHKGIRLYEGLAFEFATGETKKVYIGQAGIGALSADVKSTAKEAIERAIKLADRIVNKKLLGDDA
jgi:hypothetical protein